MHTALLTFATTSRAGEQFAAARAAEPVLARFESPSTLIVYLETETKDPVVLDDKDALYAGLIRGVQARAAWTEIAHTIIWCGLWPGLNRAYKQRRPRVARERDELAATITTQLIRLTGSIDLTRVHRIAATLARSTLREATREQSHDRREAWIWSGRPFPEAAEGEHKKPLGWLSERSRQMLERARDAVTLRELPDDVGTLGGMSFEAAYEGLRRRLLPALRDDTDLVLGVLVLEKSHREIAERLGIAPDTMSKRFERALPLVGPFLLHFPPLKRR